MLRKLFALVLLTTLAAMRWKSHRGGRNAESRRHRHERRLIQERRLLSIEGLHGARLE